MSQNPRRDRYDVAGNVEAEYADADQTVLRNKLGITSLVELQLAEEAALAVAYETLLHEVRSDTPLTCELLRHVHSRIFGKLYAWAGRWRTVTISKPGITWPPPIFVPQAMDDFERNVLQRVQIGALASDAAFCAAVAEIRGEFLVVHPFREGNARTIKLCSDLVAAQTGRPPLVYDQTEVGQESYIIAASQAFGRNYRPMEKVIHQALATALRQ